MLNYYFDTERMKHPNSGLYEYCAQLGRALAQRLRADETITYYVPRHSSFEWSRQYAMLRQHEHHRLWLPRQRDASVWHCTYQQSRYAPRWRVPLILTVHDLNFLYEPRSSRSRAGNLNRLRTNVARADYIVAISQFVASDLRKHTCAGDKPLHVIHNGCDVDYDPAFDSPSYRPARPFCFSIGPTIPKKNFHVLPRLLPGNDFELVIAGSTKQPYLESIRNEAQRHGVADRVRIIGNVTQEEKFWYFRHCAAFVFPSIAEGFGIPVIEAMWFGKPVFLSKLTSLPEVGSDFAHYFDSFDADAMSATFEQGLAEPLSEARRTAIMEHARSFTWSAAADRYLELYRRAARDRS